MLDHLAIFACPGAIIGAVVSISLIDHLLRKKLAAFAAFCPLCNYPRSTSTTCSECGCAFSQFGAQSATAKRTTIAWFIIAMAVCTVLCAAAYVLSTKLVAQMILLAIPPRPGFYAESVFFVVGYFGLPVGSIAALGFIPACIASLRCERLLSAATTNARSRAACVWMLCAALLGAAGAVVAHALLSTSSTQGVDFRIMLMPGTVLLLSSMACALAASVVLRDSKPS